MALSPRKPSSAAGRRGQAENSSNIVRAFRYAAYRQEGIRVLISVVVMDDTIVKIYITLYDLIY